MKKILLITIMLLGIAACDRLETGKVVDKFHEESRRWTTYSYNTVTKMSMPVTHYDDEDFVLMVQGTTPKGKTRTERHEVRSSLYYKTNVGDTLRVRESK